MFYPSNNDGDKLMKPTPLLLLAALLAAGSVQAQPQAAQGKMSPEEHARAQACEKEMKHLCAGKQGQAAKECLQSNESKLSPQCKAQVSK
jgi:hypothetical protein